MKHHAPKEIQIPVFMMKEGASFVCYSPAFDLVAHGDSFKDAESSFVSTVNLFCESVTKKGTWPQVFEQYGWRKIEKRWAPPEIIKQESIPVRIPAGV